MVFIRIRIFKKSCSSIIFGFKYSKSRFPNVFEFEYPKFVNSRNHSNIRKNIESTTIVQCMFVSGKPYARFYRCHSATACNSQFLEEPSHDASYLPLRTTWRHEQLCGVFGSVFNVLGLLSDLFLPALNKATLRKRLKVGRPRPP